MQSDALVIGLDLSLASTGLVVLGDAADVRETTALTTKLRGMERLADIEGRVLVRVGRDTRLWVIEGYSFGSKNMAKHMELAELGGVVKQALWRAKQTVLVVPPTRVKKFACGAGNAKKDDMRLAVYKRWGFEARTTDEVDAYALARIGLAYLGLDDKLTGPQREIVTALRGEEETA